MYCDQTSPFCRKYVSIDQNIFTYLCNLFALPIATYIRTIVKEAFINSVSGEP